MKFIKLTKGRWAKVDDLWYAFLSKWRWTAAIRRDGRCYAVRYSTTAPHTRGMHQELAEAAGIIARLDHKDGDGLNNQWSNLCPATVGQNGANRRKSKNKSSQFKGVSLNASSGAWKASIRAAGKTRYLGSFSSEVMAARAYDIEAHKSFGEFAKLNFPHELEQLQS